MRETVANFLANLEGVRVVADPQNNQLLVAGNAEAQRLAEQAVKALDKPMPVQPAAAATPSVASAAVESAAPVESTRHRTAEARLANSRVERVEALLGEIFGKRMQRATQNGGERPAWLIAAHSGQQIELEVDAGDNRFIASGSARLVTQIVRLIQALDSPRPTDGSTVRIVPLEKSDPAKVQQAFEAFRVHGGAATEETQPVPPAAPAKNDQSRRDESYVKLAQALEPVPGERRTVARSLFRVAKTNDSQDARLAQIPTPPPPGDVLPPEPPAPGIDAPPAAVPGAEDEMSDRERAQLRELGADVEIEPLSDLDVVILRGRERDVNELVRIIEEIERISAQTVPQIEVIRLQHAGSEALARVITQIQGELVTGRQGRAMVAALQRPNALLLVGWGEAFAALRELIEKLDQPIGPESQFRVFRLRNASAGNLQTTLLDFFKPTAGQPATVDVTADRRTNSLVVQASPRDLAEIELLLERLDTPAGNAVNVLRVFRLQNTLAADLAPVIQAAVSGTGPAAAQQGGATPGGPAAQRQEALEFLTIDAEGQKLLRSGVLNDVRITGDPRTNTLVVSAPPESIDLISALVQQLDQVPATTAQIKVFRVVNGDAARLVLMLQTLLGTQAVAPGGPQLAGAEGEGSLAPLRFSVDQRTNSIIASGSPGDLTIVEAILLRLDETDIQERKSTVYRLKNAPALDVAQSINEFLRSERRVQEVAPGTFSPFQQIEAEVVVVPEPVSNSLIISATQRFYDEIVQIVERLDAQPPQVMIQVLIGEVQLNNIDEFGVELGIQDSLLFDRSLLGNLVTVTNSSQQSTPAGIITQTKTDIVGASNTPGYLFNDNGNALGNSGSTRSLATANDVAGQALTSFAVGRTNAEAGFGGLVLSASSENVSILIRALREHRRLDVLSRPQVMTLDNQPAFIQVGQRVPQITNSALTQFGVSNSITLINVGLILAVTPRISPDGTVVMELDAENSAVGPEAQGIPVSITSNGDVIRSPRIDVTTAQTTVSAADGQTIVLGGLITKRKEAVNRRVPYLSDVPLLGILFRYDLMAVRRTELLIILTPHVVRGEADANRVKQMEAARMSWCLGDVNAIQGETGIFRRGESELADAGTMVIYPDDNPRGEVEAVDRPEPIRGASPMPPGELPGPQMPANELPGPQLPPAEGQQELPTPIMEPDLPTPDEGARKQPATKSPLSGATLNGQQVGTVIYRDVENENEKPPSAMSKLKGVFKLPKAGSAAPRAVAPTTNVAANSVGRPETAKRPDAKDFLPQPAKTKNRNLNRP